MLVPYLAMDTDNRKREGETQPHWEGFKTPSPKRSRQSGDDLLDDEADQEVTSVNATSSKRQYSNKLERKVFNDSIHGHIEVHPLCVKIIDTPQFQRLRNIKQLGGCYYVFPGASHNRFEHCIGTCHLAGELVRCLHKRQPELGISDKDILCVEIAGLCHDLGHGPFSHLFDALFIPAARQEGTTWKHEVASLDMFDHMVEVNGLKASFEKYNLNHSDEIFIKELIRGAPLPKDESFKGRGPEKRYLYEIVANKRTGIDVDKFDYFSRDCHHLGIRNSFDLKRYMEFARVIEVNGERQICQRDKEAANLYDMFYTRKSLHQRAYQHKTSNIIELMITEALLKADDKILLKGSNGEKLSISKSIDDMVAYTRLTDHVYYQILSSDDPGLEEARSILQRIEKRDLYRCIGQKVLKTPRDKEKIRDEIVQFWPGEPPIAADDFIVEIVPFNYGMGDKNPIDEVWFYQKNATDKPIRKPKDEVSIMLPEKFSEQSLRVYFRRTERGYLEKAIGCFDKWWLDQQSTTSQSGPSNRAVRRLSFRNEQEE